MAEPLKITDDMKARHQEILDKNIELVNEDIKKAIEYGWNSTEFSVCDDEVYDEVKKMFMTAGYTFKTNPYASMRRVLPVVDICW